MPTPGLLGKRDAIRPHGLSELPVYAAGKLPAPPAGVAPPQVGNWSMLGNGPTPGNTSAHPTGSGDCTWAGAGHLTAAWDVDYNEADPVPTTQEVLSGYYSLTDGQDTGCVEATVLKLWHSTGLFGGSPIAGYAPVNPSDLTSLHQAIAFYGGAYVGVQLPESAQEQFSDSQPWTVDPHSPIEGGHCIVFVGYSPTCLYAVSWGKLVEVTYPWWAKYGDEAWCVLPHQLVAAGADVPGIDLATLQADLAAV